MSRFRSLLLLLILPVALSSALAFPRRAALATERPNVLIFLTDDQRRELLDVMPRTKTRIFDAGLSFTNAFITTPLCCPARSSIFTGMYVRHHGVFNNPHPLTEDFELLARRLHDGGYYTGNIGKYLNSWPGNPRPEYDYWVNDKNSTVVGTEKRFGGYHTYKIRDYALDFLDKAATSGKPFYLVWAPHYPHEPAEPAPGDENLFPDLPPHRPPSFNEADVSDKPRWLQQRPLLTETQITEIDALRRRMHQNVQAIDRSVAAIVDKLATQGRLDNTLVVFLSDHGYFWGEHRLDKKSYLYEEAVHVPFGVRYPPLIAAPRLEHRLVANIDLAPTIYELTGVAPPAGTDGASLVPILANNAPAWRDTLLLEAFAWDDTARAIRTARYVYMAHENQRAELYDLQIDPYQIANKQGDPAYTSIEADLRGRLNAMAAPPIDNTSTAVQYSGTWSTGTAKSAQGWSYHRSSAAGASASFTFTGSRAWLVTAKGSSYGKARIEVDGVTLKTVDLYRASQEWQHPVRIDAVGPGTHTVRVVVIGTRNPSSSSTTVVFDAVRVP